MADILLSALVETVVGNMNSLVLKEIESAWGLRSELDNLRSTLSTIKAVLQDAEEKQWNDELVRNWLGKLKDVAYDADHVLDEFATEALIRKVESEKGALSKVRTLPNRLIFRMKMAHNLKNVRDKLEAISKERAFHLREGIINMEVNNSESRQTFSGVNEREIYGRGEEKEKMIQVLLTNESDDLAFYAVWGMAGLGKTTLAQLVYNDVRVEKYFEMRIWVCVSDDFKIRRLIKAMIESIDGRASDLSELDPLQKSLQEKLRGRRYLLLLDDVWNENEVKWNELKYVLCCGAKGSKVIVTTRNEKIALMMATPTLPTHHIGGLSEDDSWSLFKERAFRNKRAEEKLELESIGKEIVKKCGGVPLAINALGSLLCLEGKNKWSSVKESQIWNLPIKDENSILPALRLSYHHLAPHMRQCFAYCCVFPKDTKLERDNLIQLWMALDFIPSRSPLELYDAGLDIFNELVWRTFFQDVEEESPGYITCKMHDLMHDLAQSIMELECLGVEAGKEVKVPDRIRHMSFQRYLQNTSWNEDVRKVRSLRSCIDSPYSSLKECLHFVSKQKSLRVLQFRYCSGYDVAHRSPSYLKHLRYLNLSYSFFCVLSESITRLLNLQTLKLDYCGNLTKLPNGMKHMKKLTYLGLTNCRELRRMSEGMGQLTCLQSLSCFIVGKDDGYQISELKGLNLRGELCIKDLDNVRNLKEAKNANLIGKQNLHSLSLVWRRRYYTSHVSEHVEEVLDGLQPHSNLKVLRISDYRGSKFPTWIQDLLLQDLVEISLGCCGICEPLPPLGKLRFLKVLAITGMGGVKYLGNEFHGDSEISFPSLTTFCVEQMFDLEVWRTVDGRESYPRLSTLRIFWCPKLVELPIFPSITSLHIEKSNAMLIRSVSDLTSLSSLVIEDINELSVLPDGLLQNHKMLKVLHISRLPNLKELTNQLDNLSALKDFRLTSCDELESLPDGLQNLHSLQELYIQKCNNLMSFPMNGLRGLSSLRRLEIFSCHKFSSLSEEIQYLTALEDLCISRCSELTSLPEGIQHLTALRSLTIQSRDGLSSLLKQIGSLRSLSVLCIAGSNLMSIPDELQNLTALKTLEIIRCPHLERRCKKDSGEDWHKIAHIPEINIYSE